MLQTEPHHRKSLYTTYITALEASEAIRQHTLFSGILKVSAQDSSGANVECEALGATIYIYGSRNRNRALDGDEVAVELVTVGDMMHEKEAKLQARRTRRLSSGQPLTEEMNEDEKEKPKYCGKVVCILERPRNMLFSGTLSLHRPLSTNNHSISSEKVHHSTKIIWFVPLNKRLPLVAVPIRYAPAEFVKYHEEYKNRIFVGSIQRWPASSLHPFGTIVKEIGWMGELAVHSGVLAADYHLKDSAFSETTLKTAESFPPILDTRDRKGRRNLQLESNNIFTLGESEQDLEAAFSVSYLDKGALEVGIHITDVENYVRPSTSLDREARERSCTVNLVDKSIPILPPSLVDTHCKLTADKERLTISLFCRFAESGSLLHTWIVRSLIKSKCHVKPSSIGEKKTEIEADAFNLLNLCRKLRRSCLEKERGFSITKPSVIFNLGESGYPESAQTVELTEADLLKNELFRIVNIEVGQRISSKFPDQALLYREKAPTLSMFQNIQNYFNNDLSCLSIYELVRLVQKEPEAKKQQALRYIVSQKLPKSEFYSAGSIDISKYQHFRMGAPIYAVFTEPLNNYASIVVQRQLTMALKGDRQEKDDRDSIERIARHCNAANMAKYAAEQESKKLYAAAYIYRQSLKNMKSKKVKLQPIVIGFEETSMLLYFPEYDMDLSVVCDENTMRGHASNKGIYDQGSKKMCLTWNNENKTFIQKVEFLSTLSVELHVDMQATHPLFFVEIMYNSA